MQNTAIGAAALLFNTTGSNNTAVGAAALVNNNAYSNTAVGALALNKNTWNANTAVGYAALSNTSGDFAGDNTAVGFFALRNNTSGDANTGIGHDALLGNTTGRLNTALGFGAGLNATDGNGNVYIGSGMFGFAGEEDTTYIRNVYDSVAVTRAVYVNSSNKIGTLSSSRRYKEEIKPMAEASQTILALRPVTFRYKKDIDSTHSRSFGLIAEEVAKVDPDLVTPDRNGKPETVRYEAVNAMLLNEFLKEHRKNEEQQAIIAQQQQQIEALTAGLQKVSDQLELNKPATQVVNNP